MLEKPPTPTQKVPLGAPQNGILARIGEARALAFILLFYAAFSLFIWSGFQTQYDEPNYTEPAASYVLGQGFTAGSWYLQASDEFWAGNVPMHQFLLIGLFKAVGFSRIATHSLNIVYLVAALSLLWVGMRRTGLVPEAGMRLGALAFFMVSDSSLLLVLEGRPEPLCLLIASIAWVASTLEKSWLRWGILSLCGVLAPWIGLQLVVAIAFFGIVTLVFAWKRHWANVLAIACGGILGTVLLLLFYWQMGMLETFLVSISPHTLLPTTKRQIIAGVKYQPSYQSFGDRFGYAGLDPVSVWYTIALAAAACFACYRNKLAPRLIALSLTIILGVPNFYSVVGIFPNYYACFLLIPLTVVLFAMLSVLRNAGHNKHPLILSVVLCLSAAVPGGYLWRVTVQGIPSLLSDNNARIEQFLKEVTRPNDVAWVDNELWYETKPLVKVTLSSFWASQAKTGKDRDAVSVVITVHGNDNLECLPGQWKATGEVLEIPDFHRFYKIWIKDPYRYVVYRRISNTGT